MKNFALIGCGAIAEMHATAIEAIGGAALYGVYDTRSESAARFAKKHGCRVFSTVEELCSCPQVDIVSICTPSGLHADLAIMAAEAGKHIVVEKPMAITKEQLDRLVETVEAHHVKVEVITQLRFSDAIKKTKKAIDEGRLGKILLADFRGKFFRSEEYYAMGGWRGTWAMDGGGALMNQGVHGVDLIQYLMGGIKSVSALCRTQARNIETEDSAYLLVEYANGAIGSIHSTTVAAPGYPRMIEISGEKGTIRLEEDCIIGWDIEGEEEELGKTTSRAGSDPMAFSHSMHMLQFQDLIDAIDNDRTPLVDVHEGRKPVDVILAAYESSKTGCRVEIK